MKFRHKDLGLQSKCHSKLITPQVKTGGIDLSNMVYTALIHVKRVVAQLELDKRANKNKTRQPDYQVSTIDRCITHLLTKSTKCNLNVVGTHEETHLIEVR